LIKVDPYDLSGTVPEDFKAQRPAVHHILRRLGRQALTLYGFSIDPQYRIASEIVGLEEAMDGYWPKTCWQRFPFHPRCHKAGILTRVCERTGHHAHFPPHP
jgi:hypothetical protein